MSSISKYIAELLGTFVLVFIGTGSAVLAGSQIGFLGISFAFGVSVLVMVYAIGPISGCHINPAITIGMVINNRISVKDTIFYILFQVIGAILGSLTLFAIATGNTDYSLVENGLGQNGYEAASPGQYSLVSGFIAEVVLTFIFLLVIFGATHKNGYERFAGLAIGLTLFIIHLVGIPVTGTSVNPARSTGPALVLAMDDMTALSQLWLFWVAPIIGAVLAGVFWLVYKRMLETDE